MTIAQAIKENYYILVSLDIPQNMTSYTIVKDISKTKKIIICELNKAGFIKAKNEYNFKAKFVQTSFLNYTPFAFRNKENIPMMEYNN